MVSGNHHSLSLYACMPVTYKQYFENVFYTTFSTSDVVGRDIQLLAQRHYLHFSDKAQKSIITKQAFTHDGTYMDPFKDILSLYSSVPKQARLDMYFRVQFSIPATFRQKLIRFLSKLSLLPTKKQSEEEKKESEKKEAEQNDNKPQLFMDISYALQTSDIGLSDVIQQNIKSAFSSYIDDGGLSIKPQKPKKPVGMKREQAVNFFHLPTKANFVKWLEYNVYRKLPYPTNLPTLQNTDNKELTVLGKTDYRDETTQFWLKTEDKFRHLYIVGKTGTGKSTFLSNMVKSDMMAWNWLCLLDPHGDLVDTVMEHVPSYRTNDVILFDVSDSDFPIGFNLFQYRNEDEKNRIVSWIVSVFHKLFAHSRWPRLEYILRNIGLSLIEYPNATLGHLLRMLTDSSFREEVISHVTDPVILKFRREEFDKRQERQVQEAIAPITNKVGQFLSSKVVRNIFSQPNSKLNIRECMDQGKILLINLSKGKIGEDNAAMIGSFLVTKFQIDAMGRADIPMSQRKPFYLYIDEFQNFATDSFAVILSEARKYKLSLIMANQYTSQLLDTIKDAIFGNVGTMISFTVGYDDAKIISHQYKEAVSENDLISLPRFTAYTKMMVDGITSDPFSMKTMPLSTPDWSQENIDKIKRQSRQRYGIARDELEKLMDARSKKTFSQQEKIAEKAAMEWLWLPEEEIANLDHPYIQHRLHYFSTRKLEDTGPDAILFDTENGKHACVFFQAPAGLNSQCTLTYSKGETITTPSGETTYADAVVYTHNDMKTEWGDYLVIIVGEYLEAKKILKALFPGEAYKYAPNVPKTKAATAPKPRPFQWTPRPWWAPRPAQWAAWSKSTTPPPTSAPQPVVWWAFSIDDITIGETYNGYVKLIYNYGIFVTVKWVEWLLHKNFIVEPSPWVDRKKFYNVGDKIAVKASEFKEIKWEKRVVWSQKGQ